MVENPDKPMIVLKLIGEDSYLTLNSSSFDIILDYAVPEKILYLFTPFLSFICIAFESNIMNKTLRYYTYVGIVLFDEITILYPILLFTIDVIKISKLLLLLVGFISNPEKNVLTTTFYWLKLAGRGADVK